VGERAIEIVQVAATALAGRLRVDDLSKNPSRFQPTPEFLMRAAYRAVEQFHPEVGG
jgi:hypothetical protein